MNSHDKKMVAPIIVAVCFILYYGAVAAFFISVEMTAREKLLMAAVSVAVSVLLVKVLFERIKEIKKGEEDDLSQY